MVNSEWWMVRLSAESFWLWRIWDREAVLSLERAGEAARAPIVKRRDAHCKMPDFINAGLHPAFSRSSRVPAYSEIQS